MSRNQTRQKKYISSAKLDVSEYPQRWRWKNSSVFQYNYDFNKLNKRKDKMLIFVIGFWESIYYTAWRRRHQITLLYLLFKLINHRRSLVSPIFINRISQQHWYWLEMSITACLKANEYIYFLDFSNLYFVKLKLCLPLQAAIRIFKFPWSWQQYFATGNVNTFNS